MVRKGDDVREGGMVRRITNTFYIMYILTQGSALRTIKQTTKKNGGLGRG